MPVRTREKHDVLLVIIKDKVTMEDSLEFGRAMKEALEGQWPTILVVVATKMINSHCLGTIFAAYREAIEAGKTLKVVCDYPHSVASIKRFDPKKSIHIYGTVEEAILENSQRRERPHFPTD